MAQEASEASVASSSPTPNCWEIHANPVSSWYAMNRWHPSSHPATAATNSSEEDISISAASFTSAAPNQSGPSMDSSSADISGEPVENQLWNHVLLSLGSGGDLQSNQDDGENFLEVLSSKSLQATEIFDPACDYLKKLDSSWEFTNPTSFNSLEKQLNGYNGGLIQHERLTNLADLVRNWSIAPPNPQVDHRMAPSTCNIDINPSMARYSTSNISHIKHELPNSSPSYPSNGGSYMPLPYMHEMKGGSQHHEIGVSEPSLLRPFSTNGIGYQIGLNNSVIGLNNKFSDIGVADIPWSNTRNLSDLISFGSCINKPSVEFRGSKPSVSSESKRQGCETSSSTRGSGRASGTTSEGKKKRSEDSSDGVFKKAKSEASTTSSLKLQVPKVKIGDRITSLQQIVSPFGKTDTASVLLEAIKYIRFLQEQIQLLSDPYMKSSANKDHNSWGGLERNDKTEPKMDLRSRGLCLVPVSCTPQVYRDNTGPDYWTPPYRGCLYR